MKRTIYRVKLCDGGWEVRRDGAERASRLFETKEPAVEYGIDVARKNQPSQLVIYLASGEFEEERTYGNDPYPPRG